VGGAGGQRLTFADRDLRISDQHEDAVRSWLFDLAATAALAYLKASDSWEAYHDAHASRLVPAAARRVASNIVPFPSHRAKTGRSPTPDEVWTSLRRELERTRFDQADWASLAAATEPLRTQLASTRPTLSEHDSRVDALLRTWRGR
jgi:hypothetical protein